MNIDQKLEQLYRAYREETKTCLSIKEFSSLILTYPAFKVAISDGVFDVSERLFMLNICEGLVRESQDEITANEKLIIAELYAQYSYLANKPIWDILFIDLLKLYLEQNTNYKKDINEMIISVAAESGDEDSKIEKESVKYLQSVLCL